MEKSLKIKILDLLRKEKYLTIEDISKKLRINRSTASKYLAVLEATGHVKYRNIGKAKLFSVIMK